MDEAQGPDVLVTSGERTPGGQNQPEAFLRQRPQHLFGPEQKRNATKRFASTHKKHYADIKPKRALLAVRGGGKLRSETPKKLQKIAVFGKGNWGPDFWSLFLVSLTAVRKSEEKKTRQSQNPAEKNISYIWDNFNKF